MFFKNFSSVSRGGRRHGNSDTKIFQQQLTAPHTHSHTNTYYIRTPTPTYKQQHALQGRQTDRRTDRRAGTLSDTYLHPPQATVTSLEGGVEKDGMEGGRGCGWTLKRRTSLNFQLKNENCAVADGFTKMMPILRRMFPHSSGNSEKATAQALNITTNCKYSTKVRQPPMNFHYISI